MLLPAFFGGVVLGLGVAGLAEPFAPELVARLLALATSWRIGAGTHFSLQFFQALVLCLVGGIELWLLREKDVLHLWCTQSIDRAQLKLDSAQHRLGSV